jgi:hypothetical protein
MLVVQKKRITAAVGEESKERRWRPYCFVSCVCVGSRRRRIAMLERRRTEQRGMIVARAYIAKVEERRFGALMDVLLGRFTCAPFPRDP